MSTGWFRSAPAIVFPSIFNLSNSINKREYFWLAGFENNKKNGTGTNINFILSNGERTQGRDRDVEYHTHMMPKNVPKMIRAVKIFCYKNCVSGFVFFDSDGELIY
jgi:hypothetical protein